MAEPVRGARLLALAALGAVMTVTGAPAEASAPPGSLVISGAGGSWTDVTLARAVTFLPMRLTGTVDQNGVRVTDGWSATGCGDRIRGFYFRPLAGDPMRGAGAVDFPELRFGQPTDLPWIGGAIPRQPTPLGASHMGITVGSDRPARLSAGRYRVFLLGEGRCQVRVVAPGVRGTLRVRTVSPAVVQHAVTSMEPVATAATPGARVVAAAVPLAATRSTLAFAFLHRVGIDSANGQFVPSTVNAWEACVEADSSPVCSGTVTPRPRREELYVNGTWGMPPWVQTPAGPVTPRNGPFPSVTQIGHWYAPGWLDLEEPLIAKVVGVSGPTTTALQAVVFALDL